MKKRQLAALIVILLMFVFRSHAQNAGINEDGSSPNPNAILDVKSFTKGLLIPRVSTAARLAIPNTKGLLVYDTTAGSFWYNTGSAWQNIAVTGGSGTTVPAAGTWTLAGNRGNGDTAFLGTTDTSTLNIRVNNLPSGQINPTNGNTFWGYNSGTVAQPLAHYNTGIGAKSLMSLTTGFSNTAVGYLTLSYNTFGGHNTAIGYQNLTGNTTGSNNTAVGDYGLFSNTTGLCNTALGSASLQNNTTGDNNAGTGFFTLGSNTTGNDNTATGSESMASSTTGSENTATGVNTLQFNTTGSNNTAMGANSMINTGGNYNTALGSAALGTNINGSNNTALGALADVTGDLTNATAIGYHAVVNASNKVRIGNSSVTVIEGQVPFTTPSDGRFKYQVREDVKGLNFILALRPVTYQFDVQRFDDQLHGASDRTPRTDGNNEVIQASYRAASAIRRSGFIAQEVEKAANSSGYNFSGIIRPETEQDHYSLSYESFVVPLVKGMQEQQQIIAEQQQTITGQQNTLAEQQHTLAIQQNKLAALQQQLDELRQLILRHKK